MASKETERKCFTFLWKLKNISHSLQKKGSPMASPTFVVDAIEGTKWKLLVYPRGNADSNYIGYFLNREADSKGADMIEIGYELAFIAKDGSVLASYGSTACEFLKGESYGNDEFAKRECVYISRRSDFLPRDTLMVSCKMWKNAKEMTKVVRCIACTCIGVEKRTFLWNVKRFSTLKLEEKCTYQLKSMENNSPLLSLNLFLTGILCSEEIITFDFSIQDTTIKLCALRLSVVDALGKRVKCNQEEIWLQSPGNCKQFTFVYTKKDLLSKKSMCLPNDVLTLSWECAFSKGVLSNKIEEVQQNSPSFDFRTDSKEKKLHRSNSLSDTLEYLYDKQLFCDLNLKTTTSIFPAHKIILSASSSVFNAMFSSEMQEKITDCVIIEDLSDDTVRRMLLYIYSARVENLTWESASHTYVAADKYAILGLKNICSSYLKENLSSSNACQVLLLSDLHADGDLKKTVQDYILRHIREIINYDEWKVLVETNGKLAVETLCLRY